MTFSAAQIALLIEGQIEGISDAQVSSFGKIDPQTFKRDKNIRKMNRTLSLTTSFELPRI